MTALQIEPRRGAQSLQSISTQEIQHAFQQIQPRARRKRTADTFAIAEDPEGFQEHTEPITQDVRGRKRPAMPLHTGVAKTKPNTLDSTIPDARLDRVQPWKSLRSRNISTTISKAATTFGSCKYESSTTSGRGNALSQATRSTHSASQKASERVPLAAGCDKIDRPNVVVVDRVGSSTGKENVPPNSQQTVHKRGKTAKTLTSQKTTTMEFTGPCIVTSHRPEGPPESPGVLFITSSTKLPDLPGVTGYEYLRQIQLLNATAPTETNIEKETVTIDEDIEDMSDEEEHVERGVLLLETVNSLFETCATPSTPHTQDLKPQFLQIYQAFYFETILRKVDASVRSGALNFYKHREGDDRPQINLEKCEATVRKQFIHLWTQSYEPHVLLAALETVVGKKIKASGNNVHASIQQYIEGYLVFNKDAEKDDWYRSGYYDDRREDWAWSTTMRRSLALILLIDQAKLNGVIPGNIFPVGSESRSSLSVLKELNLILRGFYIEAIRVLKALGYNVKYSQDSSPAYDFRAKVLQRDFRDGIRLAKLFEVITTSSVQSHPLKLSDLKHQAKTETDKSFNVRQVILALDPEIETCSLNWFVSDIVAGDLWYTLLLLSSLMRHYGVRYMVDLDDVCFEIARLEREAGIVRKSHEYITRGKSSYSFKCETALLKWLALLGKKHGVEIVKIKDTFTSKPSPFIGVVKEYFPYLTNSNDQPAATTKSYPLKKQLLHLGFSTKFATLLSQSRKLNQKHLLRVLPLLAFKFLVPTKKQRHEKTAAEANQDEGNKQGSGRVPRRSSMSEAVLDYAWYQYFEQQKGDFDWFDSDKGPRSEED